jgi:cytoskeletal protein RodZ
MQLDARVAGLGQASPTISTDTPAMACSFLQTLFGYCPTVVLTQPAIMTTTPAAPQTAAQLKPGGWTIEDMYQQTEQQIANNQARDAALAAAYGGMTTNPTTPSKCNWYQSEDSAGGCTFGSTVFWVAAAAGGAAALYLMAGRR